MQATALCLRLLIKVFILLAAEDQPCRCAEKDDAAFLRVSPNGLQFFLYDSIAFDCEGFEEFAKWRVMRSTMGIKTICGHDFEITSRPCVIQNAFESDSGEYWCEAQGTKRSDAVNISVTAGDVILQIPALPVMVGDTVTLICKNKTTSLDLLVDFYKDGNSKWTNYEQHLTIHNVSKSDEGLYKCVVNGAGESAQSWLSVRERRPSHHPLDNHWWITVGICLLMLVLLVVGLRAFGKHRASQLSSDAHPQLAMDTYSPGKMSFRDRECDGLSATPDLDHNITDECLYYEYIN